jgi:hypothetical protein
MYIVLLDIGLILFYKITYDPKVQQSNISYEKQLFEFVHNITNERHLCFYCINKYSTIINLEELLKHQQLAIERDQIVKDIRIFLTLLSFYNITLGFIIFGGPVLISVISIISGGVSFMSLFVDDLTLMLCMEYSIGLTFTIITFKSIISLSMTMMEIHERELIAKLN